MGEGRCVLSAPRGVQTGDRSLLDQFGRSYALECKNRNSPAGDTYWKLAVSPPDSADAIVHESEAISHPRTRSRTAEGGRVTVVWLPSSSPRGTQLLAS